MVGCFRLKPTISKPRLSIFPKRARYEYLLNLPDNAQVGEAINHAMELIEEQSAQLKGILLKVIPV